MERHPLFIPAREKSFFKENIMTKKTWLKGAVIVIIAALALTAVTGCSKKDGGSAAVGKKGNPLVNTTWKGNNSDGAEVTYSFGETDYNLVEKYTKHKTYGDKAYAFIGTYTVDGDKVLRTNSEGKEYEMTLRGNTLIAPSGYIYTKVQ
jgi:hypothetical protein